jgi:hypothetical protein
MEHEDGKEAPRLPVDAVNLRTWCTNLPGLVAGLPFEDRLALFAAVVAVRRELRIAEQLTFLLAAEGEQGEGGVRRSLKRLAEPISSKSLERAAASRLTILRRKYPFGSADMIVAVRARAERLAAEEAQARDGVDTDTPSD